MNLRVNKDFICHVKLSQYFTVLIILLLYFNNFIIFKYIKHKKYKN